MNYQHTPIDFLYITFIRVWQNRICYTYIIIVDLSSQFNSSYTYLAAKNITEGCILGYHSTRKRTEINLSFTAFECSSSFSHIPKSLVELYMRKRELCVLVPYRISFVFVNKVIPRVYMPCSSYQAQFPYTLEKTITHSRCPWCLLIACTNEL